MAQTTRLRLFGVPALLDGSNGSAVPVKLRTAKQLGALVYLALEGREQAVPRDRLVDLLWDGVPAERGRHSLAQACSAVRAALGSDALERTGTALRLVAPVVTDLDRMAHEFDRLALTEPLLEAEWWAGSGFAHWVDGARARLRRAAEDALRRAIGGFRRTGETGRVHAAAAVLYRLDPLSDTAVHALAERELIAGDVVGAIRLLRAHLARVREALGCVPHKDVERLLRRLEAGSHPPIERVPARLAAEAPALRPSVFVGREKELAHLEAEWQRAAEGGGFRSCLVLGPGGIGKSSLVRRFAATVAARAQPIFLVTCQEIGEGIPFAALSDLITALSRDPSVAATDPKWLAEVARIHPALRTQYPGIPEAPDAPPESIRLRVAEGMLQMLDAVGDAGPVGIIFDDLPFMDPATRDVLHVLARRLDERPVLVISTARTPESLEFSTPSFCGMTIITWSTQLRLAVLSGGSTRELASALSPGLAGEQRVLERIEAIADGNPHFTEMLVADWECHATASLAGGQSGDALPDNWQPPDSLRQAFAQAYSGLGDGTQEILQVLAVAGRRLRTDELADSLTPRRRQVDDAVLELLRRGILRLDDGSLSFKNELHRAFVYYAISGNLRRFFHARLGKILLMRGVDSYASRLEASNHLEKAGLHAEAADAVLHAARVAIEKGAPAEADSALRAVLNGTHSRTTRSDLQLLLAEAVSAQGQYVQANAILRTLDGATLSDKRSRAHAAYLRALVLQRSRLGDDRSTEAAVKEALRLAKGLSDERLVAATTQIAAEAALDLRLPALRAEAVETMQGLAESARSVGARGIALLTKGFCLMTAGRFHRAYEAFVESAKRLDEAHMELELIRALNGQVGSLLGCGRYRALISIVQDGLRLSQKLRDLDHRAMFIGNLGLGYEEAGQFEEALQCYREAARCDPSVGLRRVVVSQCNLAHMFILLGDYSSAAACIQSGREAANRSGLWRLEGLVDFVNADLFMALGETESAWPLIERAAEATRGHEQAIDTNGQSIRLQLQWALATGGEAGLTARIAAIERNPPPLRRADSDEIGGFLRWAAPQVSVLSRVTWLRDCWRKPILLGPLANLIAVGVHDERHRRDPGESAAAVVERVYPRGLRELILPSPNQIPGMGLACRGTSQPRYSPGTDS